MKTLIVMLLLVATAAGAQDTTGFLAFKATNAPLSDYERGRRAGVASCRCAAPSHTYNFNPSAGGPQITWPAARAAAPEPVYDFSRMNRPPAVYSTPESRAIDRLRGQQFLQNPPVLKRTP